MTDDQVKALMSEVRQVKKGIYILMGLLVGNYFAEKIWTPLLHYLLP
jgi:hypothetical protein